MAYAAAGTLLAGWFFIGSKPGSAASSAGGRTRSGLPLSHVFKSPLVWKLLVMQFAIGTFGYGLSSWLPSYWVNVKGMGLVSMGALTATVSLLAFACQNISGWLLDKYLAGREICAMLATAGISVYFMYTATFIQTGFTWLGIATVAVAITSPVVFTMALKYLPDEFIGTGTGIANFSQQLAGMLSPTLFGFLIRASGGSYSAVFAFVIATVVIALGAAITLHEGAKACCSMMRRKFGLCSSCPASASMVRCNCRRVNSPAMSSNTTGRY